MILKKVSTYTHHIMHTNKDKIKQSQIEDKYGLPNLLHPINHNFRFKIKENWLRTYI